jgi:hypothetical protein
MNKILETLKNSIPLTENNKSIFWNERLNIQNLDLENLKKNFGFGSFENKTLIRSILHFLFSRYLFGLKIFKTKEYSIYKELFNKMNRQIDVDAIRHIFTFNKLKKMINPNKICIIGDGKANFVIGANKIFPNAKIFSINLAETLIHDYLIIKNNNIISDTEIQVVNKFDELNSKNKKLFLIPANKKDILKEQNIDLFVNIVSFQEMDFHEVKKYFEIIKSNKSYLYCCNREKKILSNKETLIFKEYPWHPNQSHSLEICPWHQYYYSFRYPFIKKYDGTILHSFTKF